MTTRLSRHQPLHAARPKSALLDNADSTSRSVHKHVRTAQDLLAQREQLGPRFFGRAEASRNEALATLAHVVPQLEQPIGQYLATMFIRRKMAFPIANAPFQPVLAMLPGSRGIAEALTTHVASTWARRQRDGGGEDWSFSRECLATAYLVKAVPDAAASLSQSTVTQIETLFDDLRKSPSAQAGAFTAQPALILLGDALRVLAAQGKNVELWHWHRYSSSSTTQEIAEPGFLEMTAEPLSSFDEVSGDAALDSVWAKLSSALSAAVREASQG